jgi:hypothetical protein
MFYIDKYILKINLLLISFLPFTPTVNAGIFDGCFGSPGYKPVSIEKLKAKADINTKYMGICYEAAICLARAEGALDRSQQSHLVGTITRTVGSNYSDGYKALMELSDMTHSRTSLNISEITESGFVNFQQTADNEFVHTAYVQVARDGEKYLYNANKLDLDLALIGKDAMPPKAGLANRYILNTDTVAKLNAFLKINGYKIYYTPTRSVSENITSAMSAAKP